MPPAAHVASVLAGIAVFALPLLIAVVFHEVAHGAVAYRLGDPTAARAGRLTLNPVAHLDPIGTVLLPGLLLAAPLLFGTRPVVFGWARPVPVDFARLRNPRRDTLLVALAGPGTNLLLAIVSALVLGWLPAHPAGGVLVPGLRLVAAASLSVNCVLAVFNLLPIPPLDGGRVLTALLPPAAARALQGADRVGLIVVLLVVLNTNLVAQLVRPLQGLLLRLIH